MNRDKKKPLDHGLGDRGADNHQKGAGYGPIVTARGDNPVKIRIPGQPPVELQDDYLERFTLRMLQDALAQGTRGHWLRRADDLEAALVRPGDYMGEASYESVMARHDRVTVVAEQCRIHAQLFTHDDVDAGLIGEVLGYDLVGHERAVAA